MKKQYEIYTTLKQSISKSKIKQDFFIKNNLNKNFLNFIWKQKLIYGYSKIAIKKTVYIYLKYDTDGNKILINKNYKPMNLHSLYQKFDWEKNSFYIIKTIKGILTLKDAVSKKIGGFLLFKFF